MSRNWQPGQVREPHQFHPTIQTVPLETPEGGEWREARLEVPKKWALADPHSNDFLLGQRFTEKNILKYVEWLDDKGYDIIPNTWKRVSMEEVPLGVDVGIDVDFGSEQSHDEMVLFIWVFRVKLNKPMFMMLSERLSIEDDAKTFQVDLDKETLPWNIIPADFGTKDHIESVGGGDAMKMAEAHRQKLGLKREDFLFGGLEEPA